MSYQFALGAVFGWQIAIGVRLVVDFIFSITDERKRRRVRAARQADTP